MTGILPMVGVNVPWLGDAYGHDLGRNQAYPDWPAEFDWWRTDRLFAMLASRGISLVRFWLFEDGEGLLIDERGLVTGLDSQFLDNLGAFARLAERWNMRIFWTLLDGNSVRRRHDRATRSILTTPEGVRCFIEHALEPVLPLIAPTAWAIDLCNEPEAMVCGHLGNGTGLGFDWWEIAPQLAALTQAIRVRRGNLALTVGSGFQEHRCLAASHYDGLMLDALSFHSHVHEGPLPAAGTLSDTLPVIIGELGWPLPGHWARDHQAWEQGQLRLTARLKLAVLEGYLAVFLWFISDTVGNPEALVCGGDIGRPLELVSRFQASGTLALPDDIAPLPTRWARADASDARSAETQSRPAALSHSDTVPATSKGGHHAT